MALAGLLVLCGALRPEMPYLAVLAAGTIIATGAIWAVLQAVDGVTLKQAVDAWVAASETEKATRLADAETVRWIEWGLQSYFRVLLGVAFLLLGAAVVVSRLIPSWLGVVLGVGGLLSLALGFSVNAGRSTSRRRPAPTRSTGRSSPDGPSWVSSGAFWPTPLPTS